MRVTKKVLHDMAEEMNRVIPNRGFFVQYAYDQPRLERDEGRVTVSPRMKPIDLWHWMNAFLQGYVMGHGDAIKKINGE